MRRKGANTLVSRKNNDDVSSSHTYPNARRKLNETLRSFTFLKVIEVISVPPKDGKPSFYHGMATVINNSRQAGSQFDRVFFDKGGRLRHNSNFEIGPCKLLDAAWGRDHPTAMPQIGDILIGTLEDNTRISKSAKIAKVLRGWSRHGKIILELSRIVEFGTSMQEIELPKLLKQSECRMQNMTSSGEKVLHSFNKIGSDDFCVLSSIILWGNLKPLSILHCLQTNATCKKKPTAIEIASAGDIDISCTAFEFISGLSFKLEDSDILNDFLALFNEQERPKTPTIAEFQTVQALQPSLPFHTFYPPTESIMHNQNYGPPSPNYKSSSCPPSPPYIPPSCPPSPPYIPSSPPMELVETVVQAKVDSPVFRPSSPLSPPSPIHDDDL